MYKKNVQGWMKHWDFILLDMLCMNIAFALAYMTRHGFAWSYQKEDYATLSLVLTLVDFVVLIVNETMKNVLKRGYYRELAKTVGHVFLVEAIVVVYLFAIKASADYSRLVLGLFAAYYVGIAYAVRLLWKKYLRSYRRKSIKSALYILTVRERAEQVVKRYQGDALSNYAVKGICILDGDYTGSEICDVPVTSAMDTVHAFLCREWVDEVVLSVPNDFRYPSDLVDKLVEMGIVVHIEMERSTRLEWQKQEVEKIAGQQVLSVGLSMANPMQVFLKRFMDILGGIVGCLLTLVLAVIIGPMIYKESPGPIFFAQTRVGKNGKRFKMYKFRSMYLDAEARKAELMAQNRVGSGLMFKLEYDPRIIGCERRLDGTIKKGIGNFIRDYSIDEFPQFWNCLKGDLSLVGTRPPTVDEWEKYELHHRARLAIKPGITGMWQVSGRSAITDFEQVVELDKKYIKEWSMGLDFRILMQTVKVVLGKKGSM
ncbi:MAG: sugar transferase [Oscillospiraceae bacterium]|nr:sugar transferase [Oscillospiraceae bacterium]